MTFVEYLQENFEKNWDKLYPMMAKKFRAYQLDLYSSHILDVVVQVTLADAVVAIEKKIPNNLMW